MNKLVLFLIIIVLFSSSAAAAEIRGNAASHGKELAGQTVTLSKISGTAQSEEVITGVMYNFVPLAGTITDKDGNYVFSDLEDGEYRVNLTYSSIVFGENVILKNESVVNFNLSGAIEGHVLKPVQTLEGVNVFLFDESGIEVMSALTGKNGNYLFNDVNAESSYFVRTVYAGIPYTRQVNSSDGADFKVYDTTDEEDQIIVSVDHIILLRTQSGIRVDEYIEFINTGDKAFFSEDRTWLGISTPQDITGFQTDVMDCCLVRDNDVAWIDPMRPIMPGEKYGTQVSYIFNPQSEPVVFNKGMIYNTSYFSILSEMTNSFGIESSSTKKEMVSEGGKDFEVLTFINVPRGQLPDTRITGYTPVNQDNGSGYYYLIPLLAALVIGAVSYPLVKNRLPGKKKRVIARSKVPVSTDETGIAGEISQNVVENISEDSLYEMSFDELMIEKNSIFESVLALDTDFNAGNITEKEYKEIKKEYKQTAIQVLDQIKETALNLDLSEPVPVLEKIIARVDDMDVLEDILEREEDGENREELIEIIEERIDEIERDE